MENASATFQCVVIAPSGKLLDYAATSVILPAHDGQRGILANHIPMFCALGLGIMEIKTEQSELKSLEGSAYLMVDGGFALFAANQLNVVAYQAVRVDNLSEEEIEHLRVREQKRLTHKGLTHQEHQRELARAKYLEKLIEMRKSAG
jgi:F-type H+-transporting ATPase subunit epsilon